MIDAILMQFNKTVLLKLTPPFLVKSHRKKNHFFLLPPQLFKILIIYQTSSGTLMAIDVQVSFHVLFELDYLFEIKLITLNK